MTTKKEIELILSPGTSMDDLARYLSTKLSFQEFMGLANAMPPYSNSYKEIAEQD
jgi:hypothetical protein